MNLPNRVARRFVHKTAAPETLDLAWVDGLRKDFLTLFKNVDRVKTYQDLDTFRTAVNQYRRNFDYLFFERFLNRDVKNSGASWAGWVNDKLRGPAWTFSTNLRVPGGYPDQYASEATCLARFQQEAPKSKVRVQTAARAFWSAMKDVIEWFKTAENPQEGPSVNMPERYQTTLEGFRVTLNSYEEGYKSEEALEKFKVGLKRYRARAAKVAPILLKRQCPLVVEFETKIDGGGEYSNGIIIFYAGSVVGQSPEWVTHVMAHEMGHHLFRTHLSGDAQNFWHQTIKGDLGDIDLKQLLDRWPGDAWAFNFTEQMTDDPLLALQVDAFSHDRENANIQSKEDFQKLYDKGERSLRVPKTPITGYANKNPEEAFCETLGLLISRGPGALPERVRWWFSTIMGGEIKIARRVTGVQ